jgi:hypothetical protein
MNTMDKGCGCSRETSSQGGSQNGQRGCSCTRTCGSCSMGNKTESTGTQK